MKRFSLDNNIETVSWRRPLFNMITRSIVAFCAGATVCFASVSVARHFQKQSGVGGLDTIGVPEFTVDMLDVLDGGAAADTAPSDAAQSNEDAQSGDMQTEEAAEPVPDAREGLSYMTYRVRPGDMIGRIAEKHGITQDTIISVNDVRRSRSMQVGAYLKIPSISGILYMVQSADETIQTVAAKYSVDADKCARVNSVETTAPLAIGASLFVPDAHLDRETLGAINGDSFKRPLHSRYWLSSYYGWRSSPFATGRRSFHTGIDMASPYGTKIYPACEGTVLTVGYNTTYGNFVIIRHYSGYKTLYGHMRDRSPCKEGQLVSTNTVIGEVGSTGMSTGPHLHFTVFKNDKMINPLSVIR